MELLFRFLGLSLVGFFTTLLRFELRSKIGPSLRSLVSPAKIQNVSLPYLVFSRLYTSAMWSKVADFFLLFGLT